MQKTLMVMAAVVVVLGAATWMLTAEEPQAERKSLSIAGYMSAADLDKEKSRGIMDAPLDLEHPIDEIIVSRDGGKEKIHLKRDGEGRDASWTLLSPIQAPAMKFQVDKMVKPFKDPSASIYSTTASGTELGLYDLEPERRLTITLKSKGAVWNGVDLIVGRTETSESQAAEQDRGSDSWVMTAGDEGTVYRLAGKDLRTAYEIALSELRDKKLFSVKGDDITHVEVTAPDGARIVLEGTRTEGPGAKPEDPPKVEVAWTLKEPLGFKADDSAKTLARNIANARAKDFVAAADAPKDALAGPVWTLKAKTHDGVEIGLRIADGGDSDESSWAQVAGKEELAQVEKWSAKNLRKGLADVRDKRVWSVSDGDITGIRYASTDGAPAPAVERRATTFVFTAPRAMAGQSAEVGTQLKSLAELKASRFALKSELEAAAAATASPEYVAGITAAGKTYELRIGARIDDESHPQKGQRYAVAVVDGKPGEPVLLQDYVAKRFQKSTEDLRRKKLFDFTKDDIQRVQIKHPGGGTTVTLERPAGAPALELTPPVEGKKTRAAAVTTLVNTIPNLRAKAFVADKKPAEVGLGAGEAFEVTVTLTDGKSIAFSFSEQSLDDSPYARATGGPLAGQLLTVNNYQALNLKKTPDELSE